MSSARIPWIGTADHSIARRSGVAGLPVGVVPAAVRTGGRKAPRGGTFGPNRACEGSHAMEQTDVGGQRQVEVTDARAGALPPHCAPGRDPRGVARGYRLNPPLRPLALGRVTTGRGPVPFSSAEGTGPYWPRFRTGVR